MNEFTWFEAISESVFKIRDDERRGILCLAIVKYATQGELPDFTDDEGLDLAFTSAKRHVDNSINKRSSNKGGRPKTSGFTNDKTSENLTFSESENLKKPQVSENAKPKETSGFLNDETSENLTLYKLREYKLSQSKDRDSGRARFSPPTHEEVEAYAKEQGHPDFDVGRFIDYYTAQGWKLSNGNAMKDWRSAFRNWVRTSRKEESDAYDGTYD